MRRSTQEPKPLFARDLHVLGTPPALILSQDQTLQLNSRRPSEGRPKPPDRGRLLQPKGKTWSSGPNLAGIVFASTQFSKSHPVFGGLDQNTETGMALSRIFPAVSGRYDDGMGTDSLHGPAPDAR